MAKYKIHKKETTKNQDMFFFQAEDGIRDPVK